MNETEAAVAKAQAEKILRDLDGFLMAAYNIYDIAKMIPHPYSAIGDYANSFLHDFRGFAFTTQKYIERMEREINAQA